MVTRWKLYDPILDEEWTFPFNPNKMTSPHSGRNMTIFARAPLYNAAIEARGGMARVYEHAREPYEWSFSGVIRESGHYEELVRWCRKVNKLILTDHFGRRWSVRIASLAPDERRPTFRRPDRYTYEVKTMLYGAAA